MLNTGLCLAIEIPELREGGRYLVCLPMFHIGGAGWAIWAMQQGSTAVIVHGTVPENLLKTMVEQKVETALLAPALMLFFDRAAGRPCGRFLRAQTHHLWHGADFARPAAALDRIFKCRFSQLYGPTETARPFTNLGQEHHAGERLLSYGRPMFGGRVRVVDSEGNDLPPYAIGEILYQGENFDSRLLGPPGGNRACNSRRLDSHPRCRLRRRRGLHFSQGSHQ